MFLVAFSSLSRVEGEADERVFGAGAVDDLGRYDRADGNDRCA